MSADLSPKRWFAAHAPAARANGYACFPVIPGTKQPAVRGWSKYCDIQADSAEFETWVQTFPKHSVALACGEILVIDIDLMDDAKAQGAMVLVEEKLGPTQLLRVGAPPKIAMLYRADSACRSAKVGAIDLLARGRCIIAHGVHPSGREYEWLKASPSDIPLRDLPFASSTAVADLSEALARLQNLAAPPIQVRRHAPGATSGSSPTRDSATGRVFDGRDQHLSELVWVAYCSGYTTARKIADDAWDAFHRTTDLSRPKKDVTQPLQTRPA